MSTAVKLGHVKPGAASASPVGTDRSSSAGSVTRWLPGCVLAGSWSCHPLPPRLLAGSWSWPSIRDAGIFISVHFSFVLSFSHELPAVTPYMQAEFHTFCFEKVWWLALTGDTDTSIVVFPSAHSHLTGCDLVLIFTPKLLRAFRLWNEKAVCLPSCRSRRLLTGATSPCSHGCFFVLPTCRVSWPPKE